MNWFQRSVPWVLTAVGLLLLVAAAYLFLQATPAPERSYQPTYLGPGVITTPETADVPAPRT